MQNHKYIILPILLGCMFFLTGCWDNVELNEKHIVLDIAVDKGENQPYRVTYSIPDIAKLSGNDSLGEDVKTVLSVESPSIAKSVKDIENQTQDTISFTHTKALVFGENLMRDANLFKNAINSFRENMELDWAVDLIAVKGEAAQLSKAKSYQNPIIGLYVMKYFNNNERAEGDSLEENLGSFSKELQETGVAIIPVISNNEEQNTLKITGGAVIKNYQLVDWLTGDEVRAKRFLDSQVKNIPLVIESDGETYTYKITKENCTIAYQEQKGQLRADIKVNVEGVLQQYTLDDENIFIEDHKLQEVTQKINNEISHEIKVGINRAKAINVDYLQIAKDLYRKHPDLWQKYTTSWNQQLYQNMDIHIKTSAKLETLGAR